MKMAHAPPGHHSVIGRPSVNGLAYAEYVIYRGEQVGTHTLFYDHKLPVHVCFVTLLYEITRIVPIFIIIVVINLIFFFVHRLTLNT